MLKRYIVASILAGLALGAQSAVASNQWFYEGHGWLTEPPFTSNMRESGNQQAAAGIVHVAGPAANLQTNRDTESGSYDQSRSPFPISGQTPE